MKAKIIVTYIHELDEDQTKEELLEKLRDGTILLEEYIPEEIEVR